MALPAPTIVVEHHIVLLLLNLLLLDLLLLVLLLLLLLLGLSEVTWRAHLFLLLRVRVGGILSANVLLGRRVALLLGYVQEALSSA